MVATQATPPVIGLVRSNTDTQFIGKQITFAGHGFGKDLRAEQMQAIVDAVARFEPPIQLVWRVIRHRKKYGLIQMEWESRVTGYHAHAGIDAAESHFRDVRRAIRYLTPHLRNRRLTLAHVLNQSALPSAPRAEDLTLSWPFASLMHLVLYKLGPHLRTEEFLDLAGAWAKLQEFRKLALIVRGRPPLGESEQAHRISRAQLALAIYERTVALLANEQLRTPEYCRAISERERIGLHDPILDWNGEVMYLGTARRIRAEAYHEFLLGLLTRCHLELLRIGPPGLVI